MQFRIEEHSQAPLRLEAKAGFQVSPERLFSTLSNPHALVEWVPLMRSVSMESGRRDHAGECGIGSVRHCSMLGMGDLDETIVWWNPPVGYAYQPAAKIKMMLPTEDYLAVIFIESDGKGGSILTWRHYFHWRGLLMRYLAAFMLPMIMNMALRNLQAELGGDGGKMRRVDPALPNL